MGKLKEVNDLNHSAMKAHKCYCIETVTDDKNTEQDL